MKKLTNYQEVVTEDGSVTLYSKLYDENCHSLSGAREETNLHYIRGCKIDEISLKENSLHVLEVGFGTGIGFEETLKVCHTNNSHLHFVSFEIDPELIEYTLEKLKLPYAKDEFCYQVKGRGFDLYVFWGDARKTVQYVSNYIDQKFVAIYQDAFSPKRNADLWTTEWFAALKDLAAADCILSTYSASSSIRKSLLAAGWHVTKGAKFGPKRSSTRANLQGPSDPDIIEQLKRSPAPEITDQNYKHYNLKESK